MSTKDVPGANPANGDELKAGCWAQHDDGSMIFVQGAENNQVVYSIFDVAGDKPLEYRHTMTEKEFKKQYTKKNWTWHDKKPFPWDRVLAVFGTGQRDVSATVTMTEASNIAKSLGLRAMAMDEKDLAHMQDKPMTKGQTNIKARFQRILDEVAGIIEDTRR